MNLAFASQPSGLKLAVGAGTSVTPFTRTVIADSTNSITAPGPQALAGQGYGFGSWSDTGSQGHTITAGAAGSQPETFTATYTNTGPAAPTPQLDLAPASLNLTSPVAMSSPPQAVTLTNNGTADLHVNSFSTGDTHFALSAPDGCATVAPGASCPISVAFTPGSTGTVFALLTIRYDDGTGPGTAVQTVALTGTGRPSDPIPARQQALGGNTGLLGAPVGAQYPVPGGAAQNYTGGRIYYSPATGAHEVHGAILTRYLQLGGPGGIMGLPTSDETATTGAAGHFNTFSRATMYWSPATGAHEVHGAILARYLQLGGPASILRIPTSDETATTGTAGRFNTFTGGVIYWSPASGAHEVHGAILASWLVQGSAKGRLGLPVSDEYTVTGGRRSDFQHGSITWTPTKGTTTTYR